MEKQNYCSLVNCKYYYAVGADKEPHCQAKGIFFPPCMQAELNNLVQQS